MLNMLFRAVAVCFCCCLCQTLGAQQETAPTSAEQTDLNKKAADFAAAMKKCDVKTLAADFHSTIELVMPEKKQASCAKAQTEQIIKSFLHANKPTDCVCTHNSHRGNEQSTVSTLYTDKGTYRLTIQMRPVEGVLRIFSIRIEEDND